MKKVQASGQKYQLSTALTSPKFPPYLLRLELVFDINEVLARAEWSVDHAGGSVTPLKPELCLSSARTA